MPFTSRQFGAIAYLVCLTVFAGCKESGRVPDYSPRGVGNDVEIAFPLTDPRESRERALRLPGRVTAMPKAKLILTGEYRILDEKTIPLVIVNIDFKRPGGKYVIANSGNGMANKHETLEQYSFRVGILAPEKPMDYEVVVKCGEQFVAIAELRVEEAGEASEK